MFKTILYIFLPVSIVKDLYLLLFLNTIFYLCSTKELLSFFVTTSIILLKPYYITCFPENMLKVGRKLIHENDISFILCVLGLLLWQIIYIRLFLRIFTIKSLLMPFFPYWWRAVNFSYRWYTWYPLVLLNRL